VIRGPNIPAGTVCDELTGTIDVLPTIAALIETPLPKNKIDGLDASGIWKGTVNQSPRKEFLYYTSRGAIEGIRSDNWKLLIKKPRVRRNGNANRSDIQSSKIFLFNLAADIGEKNNLAEKNPKIVRDLRGRMQSLDSEITKNARLPWFQN
jgi:arylsulfatase A-like enzyme